MVLGVSVCVRTFIWIPQALSKEAELQWGLHNKKFIIGINTILGWIKKKLEKSHQSGDSSQVNELELGRIQKHLFSGVQPQRELLGEVYERLFVPHGYHYCEFSEKVLIVNLR